MTTQKTFKTRVRARMTRTGESYTTARAQLLRKAGEAPIVEPAAPEPTPAATSASLMTSDDAVRRATGRSHDEWFALLDAWGATERRHPEIARWLGEEHGAPGWWRQNITVDYERARGMRAVHQVDGGFSISVTRTVSVDVATALAAFTVLERRASWLPDADLRQRPTRAARTARFDWPDPASRVVVTVDPKGDGRSAVNVTHEQLPDADAADRLKAFWRERLGALKANLERG